MTTQQKINLLEGVKSWLFPGLVSVLSALVWLQYQKIEIGIESINETVRRIEKEQVGDSKDIEFLRSKVQEHEEWLDDIDNYLRTNK